MLLWANLCRRYGDIYLISNEGSSIMLWVSLTAATTIIAKCPPPLSLSLSLSPLPHYPSVHSEEDPRTNITFGNHGYDNILTNVQVLNRVNVFMMKTNVFFISGSFCRPWTSFQKRTCSRTLCQHTALQPHVWWVDPVLKEVWHSSPCLISLSLSLSPSPQVSLISLHPPTMERLVLSITSSLPPSSPPSHLHKYSKVVRESMTAVPTRQMNSLTTRGASVRNVSVGVTKNVLASAIIPWTILTSFLISSQMKVSDKMKQERVREKIKREIDNLFSSNPHSD